LVAAQKAVCFCVGLSYFVISTFALAHLQIPVYMGTVMDLSLEWAQFKAASEALQQELCKPETVKHLAAKHKGNLIIEVDKALNRYLTEGVLTEPYVVENVTTIMDCLRSANTSLRWALLHLKTSNVKLREITAQAFGLVPGGTGLTALLDIMLRAALLEHRLKSILGRLLRSKSEAWAGHLRQVSMIMTELADHFSGEKALSTMERDEDLMNWFRSLAAEVKALDYSEAVIAGRKIRQMIRGLEDVSQFDAVDARASVKEFIQTGKDTLKEMIRTVNITESIAADIEVITDFSFAWEIIHDFVPLMHDRLAKDPSAVAILRTLFLKLASVLNVPLLRITQAQSKDELSVAQLYSAQLVSFLRKVLAIIPSLVFSTLAGVIEMQTTDIRPLPIRFELPQTRDYAQADVRHELARKTHSISIFAEGVLAMKRTLLGVIQVDPRAILNDGIRRQLVEHISKALHSNLVFDGSASASVAALAAIPRKSSACAINKYIAEAQLRSLQTVLSSFRRSFEYVQDYLGIHGLRMWQEEFTRIIAFNTEQECNKFLRRKVLPASSSFQSTTIPIPLYFASGSSKKGGGGKKEGKSNVAPATTFIGRLTDALVALTDPRATSYGPGAIGGVWCELSTGREIAGLSLFSLLNSAVGIPGLCAVDRLLSFGIRKQMSSLVLLLPKEEPPSSMMAMAGAAASGKSSTGTRRSGGAGDCKALLAALIDHLLDIGQAQLLRRAIAHELQFNARSESSLLSSSLEAANASLLLEIRRFYHDSAKYPLPGSEASRGASSALPPTADSTGVAPGLLIPYLNLFCDAGGISDPLTKIYFTPEPQPFVAEWLYLCAVAAVIGDAGDVSASSSLVVLDEELGTLVRRKSGILMDGPPIISAFVSILKQFNPEIARSWVSLMNRHIQTAVERDAAGASLSGRGGPISASHTSSTKLLIVFLEQVIKAAQGGSDARRVKSASFVDATFSA
jgi:WASH complex subunit strumpellin